MNLLFIWTLNFLIVVPLRVLLQGLFNGDAMGAKGPTSHRARIPALNTDVTLPGTSTGVRALDVEKAVFMRHQEAGDMKMLDTWFAPLHLPNLLVHQIQVTIYILTMKSCIGIQ